MSHHALARSLRPKTLSQVVGQDAVVKLLTHSLNTNRLHHAYLFTGSRGVGKTTLARVLAKSLNCEKGISSTPCLSCQACREIENGQFIDVFEIDAASNTKVEDTRELLENVPYASTKAKFKVYIIDEVHMLSNHSFNALLKTLEEPPEHVKFILATTDPQKMPATVVSRCQQLHLRNMKSKVTVDYLEKVLSDENIAYDLAAIELIAKSSKGSMRDALTLLEQAIVFSSDKISISNVRDMLGLLDQELMFDFLENIITRDVESVFSKIELMFDQGLDFANILRELHKCLYSLSLAKSYPDNIVKDGSEEYVLKLAERLDADSIQLLYEILSYSREQLKFAPDDRIGFEMSILRMLDFQPAKMSSVILTKNDFAETINAAADKNAREPIIEQNVKKAKIDNMDISVKVVDSKKSVPRPINAKSSLLAETVKSQQDTKPDISAVKKNTTIATSGNFVWADIVTKLNLTGLLKVIVTHCEFETFDGRNIKLSFPADKRALLQQHHKDKLGKLLSIFLGKTLSLDIAIKQFEKNIETTEVNNKNELLPDKLSSQSDKEKFGELPQENISTDNKSTAVVEDEEIRNIINVFDAKIESIETPSE